MTNLNKLKSKFPDITVSAIKEYGANLYLPFCVVTVYWGKKNTYGINTTNKWAKYKDLDEFISIVKELIDKNKTRILKKTDVVQGDNGVQNCIYHTLKKIQSIEKLNPNHAVLTVLKTLMSEFQQYL